MNLTIKEAIPALDRRISKEVEISNSNTSTLLDAITDLYGLINKQNDRIKLLEQALMFRKD